VITHSAIQTPAKIRAKGFFKVASFVGLVALVAAMNFPSTRALTQHVGTAGFSQLDLTAKATPGAEHDPAAGNSVDYPPVPHGKDRSVVRATGRKGGLMNLNDMTEARDDLEKLPLGRAGLMTFELILLGPSGPLRILLSEPAK
jgi:hypothetical protein